MQLNFVLIFYTVIIISQVISRKPFPLAFIQTVFFYRTMLLSTVVSI